MLIPYVLGLLFIWIIGIALIPVVAEPYSPTPADLRFYAFCWNAGCLVAACATALAVLG